MNDLLRYLLGLFVLESLGFLADLLCHYLRQEYESAAALEAMMDSQRHQHGEVDKAVAAALLVITTWSHIAEMAKRLPDPHAEDLTWPDTEDASIDPREFAVKLQIMMMLNWLDRYDFLRGGTPLKGKVIKRPRIEADRPVVASINASDALAQRQKQLAFHYIHQAGVDWAPNVFGVVMARREQVLLLSHHLRRDYGSEGAMRFCESSHIAHLHNGEQPGADFWANVRTFLDLEPAANQGFGFDIEHFTHDCRFIGDAEGARVVESSGVSVSFTDLVDIFRTKLDGLR